MRTTLKQKLYEILEFSDAEDLVSLADDTLVTSLILLNVVTFICSTLPNLSPEYQKVFNWIEVGTSVFFTVEYGLRLWVCTLNPEYQHPLWGRIRYILTPLALIDLVAILPLYLLILFPQVGSLNLIRVLWLLRLLKMSRYSESLRTLGRVIFDKKMS